MLQIPLTDEQIQFLKDLLDYLDHDYQKLAEDITSRIHSKLEAAGVLNPGHSFNGTHLYDRLSADMWFDEDEGEMWLPH